MALSPPLDMSGMFIGHGLVVLAPRTGDVVKVVTYASLTGWGVSALRHIA